jgi:hypothetical protein
MSGAFWSISPAAVLLLRDLCAGSDLDSLVRAARAASRSELHADAYVRNVAKALARRGMCTASGAPTAYGYAVCKFLQMADQVEPGRADTQYVPAAVQPFEGTSK